MIWAVSSVYDEKKSEHSFHLHSCVPVHVCRSFSGPGAEGEDRGASTCVISSRDPGESWTIVSNERFGDNVDCVIGLPTGEFGVVGGGVTPRCSRRR